MIIRQLKRRLNKAVLEFGLLGALGRLAIWPFLFLFWRIQEQMPFDRNRRIAGEQYDREHNVDTVRDRSTEWTSEIDSENLGAGTGYDATPPETVRRSIRALSIAPEEYAFIDLGSGKGRVFLVASEFPFRECLGVEYAPDLHEVAERNIESFVCPGQQCLNLKAICQDAVTFQLPESPFVLFFAHPFGGEVLDGFLKNLVQNLAENPRLPMSFISTRLAWTSLPISAFANLAATTCLDSIRFIIESARNTSYWNTEPPKIGLRRTGLSSFIGSNA